MPACSELNVLSNTVTATFAFRVCTALPFKSINVLPLAVMLSTSFNNTTTEFAFLVTISFLVVKSALFSIPSASISTTTAAYSVLQLVSLTLTGTLMSPINRFAIPSGKFAAPTIVDVGHETSTAYKSLSCPSTFTGVISGFSKLSSKSSLTIERTEFNVPL